MIKILEMFPKNGVGARVYNCDTHLLVEHWNVKESEFVELVETIELSMVWELNFKNREHVFDGGYMVIRSAKLCKIMELQGVALCRN